MGAERDPEDDPNNQHDRPHDGENEGVGKHERDQSAHACFRLEALHEGDDNDEIGVERGDDVGGGIANAIGRLREFRADPDHHEHRDKDGSDDGVFGRHRADEEIEKSDKADEDKNESPLWHAGLGECLSARLGEHASESALLKAEDELAREEGEDDDRSHRGDAFAEQPGDVLIAADELLMNAESESGDEEGKEKDGNDDGDPARHEGVFARARERFAGQSVERSTRNEDDSEEEEEKSERRAEGNKDSASFGGGHGFGAEKRILGWFGS